MAIRVDRYISCQYQQRSADERALRGSRTDTQDYLLGSSIRLGLADDHTIPLRHYGSECSDNAQSEY